MEIELRAGAKLDLLSPREFEDGLAAQADADMRELARGVKFIRQEGHLGVNQAEIMGPDLGFVWNLKLISAVLSATDKLDIYLGSQPASLGSPSSITGRKLIAALTPAAILQVATWSSSQVIVYPGETIVIDAETSTTTVKDYFLTAVQAPAEQIWKIL